jgi:organic radical activating enzyme
MLSKEIQLEVNKGAMLPLMEEFYTIQGEGFQGTAAYFVRIGGCDVGCHWCDVKSWNAELHPPSSSIRLYPMQIFRNSCGNGGEPLMWDMTIETLGEMDEKFILKPLELIR